MHRHYAPEKGEGPEDWFLPVKLHLVSDICFVYVIFIDLQHLQQPQSCSPTQEEPLSLEETLKQPLSISVQENGSYLSHIPLHLPIFEHIH